MAIAIIINPVAGGASLGEARLRAQLAVAVVERHGDTAEVVLTERQDHARQLALAAATRGVRLVMAWGGDGTINEVAVALAFGHVPMGIVPAGSGNGLARELGIAQNPERAIAEAMATEPTRVDLGELGGRLFVNLAGIGVDAHVAAQFNAPGNHARGFLAYAGLGARVLLRYVPERYRVTTDEGQRDVRAVLIAAANSAQYGNGARIAPGALVDDGKLDLVIVEERSRLKTLLHLPRLFTGTVDRMPGYSIQRVETATIACDRPILFHVDGESVMGGTTLMLRVHPGALRICRSRKA